MKYDVLFLSWKRYKCILENIEILYKQGVCENIYISNDGFNKNNFKDKQQIYKVRNKFIELSKKYPEIKFYFNFFEKNKGCKEAVLEGIEWFFKHAKKGLIIEDDILIQKNCFTYLDYYKKFLKQNECFSLGLYAPSPLLNKKSNNCFIIQTPIFYCWGWFTTKEKWLDYKKYKFSILKSIFNFKHCYSIFPERLVNYFIENTILTNYNLKNSWAYLVQDYMINTKKFSLSPSINFVKNVGFADSIATHGAQETNPTPHEFNNDVIFTDKSRCIHYGELEKLTKALYQDHSKIRIIKIIIYSLLQKIIKLFKK